MPTPKELHRLHEQQCEQAAVKAALKAARRPENERNAAAKREKERWLALPVHERLAAATERIGAKWTTPAPVVPTEEVIAAQRTAMTRIVEVVREITVEVPAPPLPKGSYTECEVCVGRGMTDRYGQSPQPSSSWCCAMRPASRSPPSTPAPRTSPTSRPPPAGAAFRSTPPAARTVDPAAHSSGCRAERVAPAADVRVYTRKRGPGIGRFRDAETRDRRDPPRRLATAWGTSGRPLEPRRSNGPDASPHAGRPGAMQRPMCDGGGGIDGGDSGGGDDDDV